MSPAPRRTAAATVLGVLVLVLTGGLVGRWLRADARRAPSPSEEPLVAASVDLRLARCEPTLNVGWGVVCSVQSGPHTHGVVRARAELWTAQGRVAASEPIRVRVEDGRGELRALVPWRAGLRPGLRCSCALAD